MVLCSCVCARAYEVVYSTCHAMSLSLSLSIAIKIHKMPNELENFMASKIGLSDCTLQMNCWHCRIVSFILSALICDQRTCRFINNIEAATSSKQHQAIPIQSGALNSCNACNNIKMTPFIYGREINLFFVRLIPATATKQTIARIKTLIISRTVLLST